MTIAPHALTGSAIAVATTGNLTAAFFVGLVSHFALDALPHIDPGTFFTKEQEDQNWPVWIYVFVAIEFIVTVLVYFLFKNKANFEIILVAGIGSIIVDVLDNNPWRVKLRKLPVFKQINYLHEGLHFDLPADKWYWGLPFVLILSGVSLWFLLKF